jgi:hypothetical protein
MAAASRDTSSTATDHCTRDSCWAPTTDSPPNASAVSCRRGVERFLASRGTRTVNPAASRTAPPVVIRSKASVPSMTTRPRRFAGRRSAGSTRSRRRSSVSTAAARAGRPLWSTSSTGSGTGGPPSGPGSSLASTVSSQPPSSSGGDRRTVSRAARSLVTGVVHRVMSSAISVAARLAAWNGLPASPASTASDTSERDRATGTVAGVTRRDAPARQTASAAAPSTARHIR